MNHKIYAWLIFLIFSLSIKNIHSQYSKMTREMDEPYRKYVSLIKSHYLSPEVNFHKVEHPKISIIIPMYNEAKNAKSVIRSIQNQSLQDFEIVCVNDNSNDDTLKVLEELQQEDPRITILTNKSNRGVLYNRIFGSLKSKGEYITYIDADDALCNYDILNIAYNKATIEKGEKIDIVHYQTCGCVVNPDGSLGDFLLLTIFNPNSFEKVIKQPEISLNYFQNGNNITGSGLVFDKIYSRELIKRVADYIGPELWNQNLVFSDDFLLAYGAMRMANSIVSIGQIGYWHNFDTQTSTTSNVWQYEGYRLKYPDKTNRKILDYIIITEKVLELTENEPQFLEFREHNMKKLGDKNFIPTVARSIYYNRYLTIVENFINWKYITKEVKKRSIEFLKYLLDYNIGTRNKFLHVLGDDQNSGPKSKKYQEDEYIEPNDDEVVNNGIEDL